MRVIYFSFLRINKSVSIHIITDCSDPLFFSGILFYTKSVLKSVF